MTGYCCVFKFLRLSVDEKHLMCFQNENTVLNSSGVAWTGPQYPRVKTKKIMVIQFFNVAKPQRDKNTKFLTHNFTPYKY